MEFELAPIAKRDVLDIADHYSDISAEPAECFVTEFPFLIFYRIDGDLIDVSRLLHERRDRSADLIAG